MLALLRNISTIKYNTAEFQSRYVYLLDMKCPNDQTILVISERQNIEIDYCPECRGVWLDRGELDKILERASTDITPRITDTRHMAVPPLDYSEHRSDDHHYRKRKKESFLGDIFDF